MALLYPDTQFFDGNGNPLASGKIYTYVAGTSTPKVTYTDSTGNIQNANPLTLDSEGRGVLWLGTDSNYKIIVRDSNGGQVGTTLDDVSGIGNAVSFYSTLQHDLDLNGYNIVTTNLNRDINFIPNGTGKVHTHSNQQIDGTLDVDGAADIDGNLTVGTAAGSVTVQSSNTTPGKAVLQTNSGANTTTITSSNSQVTNITWTTPTAVPVANNAVMVSSTAGALSLLPSNTVFNTYSPVTSTGDIIIGNGSNSSTRLAVSANVGDILKSTGTTLAYTHSWDFPITPYQSSTKYLTHCAPTLSTLAVTTGTLYFIPVQIYFNSSGIAKFTINATVAGATGAANYGLYASSASTGFPTGSALFTNSSGGFLSGSATEYDTIIPTGQLTPGVYYIAFSSSVSVTVSSITNGVGPLSHLHTGLYTTQTVGFTQSFVYSATLPAVGSITKASNVPCIVYTMT